MHRDQDGLYVKGFNGGYLLEQFEPELLAKVLKDLSLSNDYLTGMASGRDERQQEQSRAQLDELRMLREGRDRDQDRER